MAVLSTRTIVGNVGNVYDLRTVGQDKREVIDFTVAITPRKRNGNDWVDGTTEWVRVTAWGKLAANIAESFRSGDQVFVHGRVDMKDAYTNKQGVEMPAAPYVVADYAGLELGRHSAKSDRVPGANRNQGSNGGSSSAPAQRQASKPAAAASGDGLDLDDDLEFNFDDDDNTEVPF